MKKPVTKETKNTGRQGDVFLRKVDSIPSDLEQAKEPILAYGEETGHKHEILDADGVTYYHSDGSDPFIVGYLEVNKPANLVHEDHEGITVYPGKYEIRNQCETEVNEEDQEIFRRVLD